MTALCQTLFGIKTFVHSDNFLTQQKVDSKPDQDYKTGIKFEMQPLTDEGAGFGSEIYIIGNGVIAKALAINGKNVTNPNCPGLEI